MTAGGGLGRGVRSRKAASCCGRSDVMAWHYLDVRTADFRSQNVYLEILYLACPSEHISVNRCSQRTPPPQKKIRYSRVGEGVRSCIIDFHPEKLAGVIKFRPSLWSSGQSFWLQIQRSRVRFPALPDFLSSSGSGKGSTQPREVNWGPTWIKK